MAKVIPYKGKFPKSEQGVDKQVVTLKSAENPSLSLDTLAFLVAPPPNAPPTRGVEELVKRAENKFVTDQLVLRLSRLGSFLSKSYLRTYYECNHLLFQEGQTITAKYCNGRWCNNCNRIRTAKMINGYGKQLQAFDEPQFVTLTIPNISGNYLLMSLKAMQWDMLRIGQRARKSGMKINGIRKLECTYNADADTYHPHFHFIVDGFHNADWMVERWLERNPTANREAQNVKDVDGNGILELFKYCTKIVSNSKRDGEAIYIKPLDTIYQALYRINTFQKMGNLKRVEEDIDGMKSKEYDIPYYESMAWVKADTDWYSMMNGDSLTGYEPDKKTLDLITKMI